MSDMITRVFRALTAPPANTDNPAAAVALEIVFLGIVVFTLAFSVGAIIGGVCLVVQRWSDVQHARAERRGVPQPH
jgi:hypothetical protein